MAEPTSSPDLPPLARHELLWVTPEAWAEGLDLRPEPVEIPLIRDWAICGWPVIVRRRLQGEPEGRLPVGVPLPPVFGKRRVAVTVAAWGVVKHAPPPPLRSAAGAAGATWRRKIAGVLALGERLGLEPAVFGSLLWQHHTGLSYLTASSDLDLLWRLPANFALMPLLAGLAGADDAPPRLDGEIVFPDGSAINWRELWQARHGDGPVLAKTMQGLHLAKAQALLAPVLTP